MKEVLARPDIWRGADFARITAEPSGFVALDRRLPGGGWPVGALTELYPETQGIGEMQLVLPWVARLTQAGGRVAFVDPPHLLYAPALVQAGVYLPRSLLIRPQSEAGGLWATEQVLRAGACGAALIWPPTLDQTALRRLQLAAEAGRTTALLFREPQAAAESSPAALRLRLAARAGGGLLVDIFKCRGGAPAVVELQQA
ncbi:MAG: translesion DNA synthesis-associated protein ImuA [Nevskia sp.]